MLGLSLGIFLGGRPGGGAASSILDTTGLVAFWDALGIADGSVATIPDLVGTFDFTATNAATASGGAIQFDGSANSYGTGDPGQYDIGEVPGVFTYVSETTLPDAEGGDAGQGYSIAGAAADTSDNSIWTVNGGLNFDGSTAERKQSIVKLDASDYSDIAEWRVDTIFPGLDTANGGDGESPQAIAVDNANGWIWIADPSAQRVRCVLRPADTDTSLTRVSAQDIAKNWDIGSICISEAGNGLWIMSRTDDLASDARIQLVSTDGNKTILRDFTVPFFNRQDHIAEKNGVLYITAGTNGGQAAIVALDAVTGQKLWASYLPYPTGPNGMVGIEGIFFHPISGQLHVTHNGYFHYGDPGNPEAPNQWPRTNIIAGYDRVGLGDMRNFDLFYLGQADPSGADAVLEFGSILNAPRVAGSMSLSFVVSGENIYARIWKALDGSTFESVTFDVTFASNTLFYFEVRGRDVTLYQDEVLIGTESFTSAVDGGFGLIEATLGSTPDAGRHTDMDLKSIGVVAGSSADRQLLSAQLLWRHGDQTLLPSGHPYENGLPGSSQPEPSTVTFGALTLAGQGGADISASDGTYGEFTVSSGRITPNTSPLTVGDADVGGAPVTVIPDVRHLSTVSEIDALISSTGLAVGQEAHIRPGTYDMSGVSWYNKQRNITNRLVIKGEAGAVLSGWAFAGAVASEIGNVTLDGIEFYRPANGNNWVPSDPAYGDTIITVGQGQDITLRRLEVHSDLLPAGEGNFPTEDIRGIATESGASNVIIEDSEVHNLYYGLRLSGTNITAQRNDIHDMHADSLNAVSPVSNLAVEANTVRDFIADQSAIHPDVFQAQGSGAYTDVTILGNVAWPGDLSRMRAGQDLSVPSVNVSSSTTLTVAAHANASIFAADGITVTLPDASTCEGETFTVRVSGSDACTIASSDPSTDYTFPLTLNSSVPGSSYSFVSSGTGWERMRPGLRTGNVIVTGDVTLGPQHIGRRVLVDTSGGPVTVTLPTGADGDVFHVGMLAPSANAITVTGGTFSYDGSTSGSISIPNVQSQRRFTKSGSQYNVSGGQNIIQGVFGNPATYTNWTIAGNVFAINATWAIRLESAVSGFYDVYNNGFLKPLGGDVDGNGVIDEADGFQPFDTTVVETRADAVVLGNIASGDFTTNAGVVGDSLTVNNIALEHDAADSNDPTKYAAKLTSATWSPTTRAEAIAMTTVRGDVPEASTFVGPQAFWDFDANAPLTVANPTTDSVSPANGATVATGITFRLTADQPVASASVVLTDTTDSQVVAATVTVEGYDIIITPDAALTSDHDFAVTGTWTSLYGGTGTVGTWSVTTETATEIIPTLAFDPGTITGQAFSYTTGSYTPSGVPLIVVVHRRSNAVLSDASATMDIGAGAVAPLANAFVNRAAVDLFYIPSPGTSPITFEFAVTEQGNGARIMVFEVSGATGTGDTDSVAGSGSASRTANLVTTADGSLAFYASTTGSAGGPATVTGATALHTDALVNDIGAPANRGAAGYETVPTAGAADATIEYGSNKEIALVGVEILA